MTLSPKMKTKPTARYLMPVLLISGLVLDVFDTFGREHTPDTVALVACTLKPFSMIASPFVTNELIAFANEQCLHQPHEPTFSIIFYMTKLALAIMTIAVFWGLVFVFPANFKEVRDQYFDRMENGSRSEQFKKYAAHIFMALLACTFGVVFFGGRMPERFNILPMHKLLEECAAGMVLFIGLDISVYAVLYASFLFRKWKSPPS